MGLVGDLTDKASSMLGTGGPAKPAGMKEAKKPLTFKTGEPQPIDEPLGNAPGSTALNHPNVFDPKMPIWFLHFGWVHTDVHAAFPHAQLDDTDAEALKNLPTGTRASAYRAALLRETLLLHGFMGAVKDVLKECKSSESAADELVGAVTSLASGGKGGGAGAPDPAQLDPYQKAAAEAGGKINKSDIKYKELHQTGIDLHQVRLNYVEFAPELNKRGDGGGGLLGNLPASLPLPPIPGVGDVSKIVMGILFKMFDVYKAMFFNLRGTSDKPAYEAAIEKACYDRSLAAIRQRYTPIFDVWSLKDPPPPPPKPPRQEQKVLDVQKTGIDPADGAVKDVNQTYDDINRKKEEAEQAWADFWKNPSPEPGPGEDQLKAVFAAVPKPDQFVLQGFTEALGVPELPGFLKTVLGKVVGTNLGMLQQVYVALQHPKLVEQLDIDVLRTAGRTYLTNMLREIVLDLVPAFSVGPGAGIVNRDMLVNKAVQMANELARDHLNFILDFSMAVLLEKLTAARDEAKKSKALTMEVFLALLPELIALMTRNTFFPIWQLIVEKVFGAAGAGAALAASPVKKLMDDGRSKVKDVQEKADKTAKDIKDKGSDISSSVKDGEADVQKTLAKYNVTVGSPAGQAAQGLSDATGGLADSILGGNKKAADGDGAGASFPGAAHTATGVGQEIKKAEWQEVTDKHKEKVHLA